ncbi:MAG TPA: PDZ domain-containing protein [Thermoanaerobaculia bacterium]|nr:PDZ domain-containing protein [Thermoanaerobaculia bacterium]
MIRFASAAIVLTAVVLIAQEPKCKATANECERAIRQMLSGRRYLGLDVADDDKPGLVVKLVHPESPAARADFKEGDRIIAVNGKSMGEANLKQFKESLAGARQTGRLWIIVQRHGAYKKIEARLEPYPEEYIEKVISGHLAQAHAANGSGQR